MNDYKKCDIIEILEDLGQSRESVSVARRSAERRQSPATATRAVVFEMLADGFTQGAWEPTARREPYNSRRILAL